MINKVRQSIVSLFFCLSVMSVAASANEMPRPASQVLLIISGNIAHHNSQNGETGSPELELDLVMLEALEVEKITTSTPWTEGKTEFAGVLVSKLLEYAGAGSSHLTLQGLDGFNADISDLAFDKYAILIAYKRDSEMMTVRSLGPLWMMFPFDDHPELLTEKNKAAAVWQLVRMVVR